MEIGVLGFGPISFMKFGLIKYTVIINLKNKKNSQFSMH